MKTKAAKSIFPKQWQATSGRVFRWVSFSGPTHLERLRLLTRLLSFEAVRKAWEIWDGSDHPSWAFFLSLLKSANWSGFQSGVKLI